MLKNDLAGKRFGKLVALHLTKKRTRHGAAYWRCRCDCGNEIDVARPNLMQGYYVSCGCVNAENRKNFRNILKETQRQNCIDGTNLIHHNQKISKNNSTGVKGVSPFYSKGVFQGYRAYITYQRKHYSGGVYPTIEEAARARKKLEDKYFKKVKEENDQLEKSKRKYSDEFLINEYKKLAEELGKIPVGNAFRYYGAAIGRFGSWNAFKRVAGFETIPAKGGKKLEYSQESLIKAIQLETKNRGSVPANNKFRYGKQAVSLFGSWNAFLEAANLPTRKAEYSKEYLIKEYLKLKKSLNRKPLTSEYRYYATVKYKWGSWRAFLNEVDEDFIINEKKEYQGNSQLFADDTLIREFKELAKKEGNTPKATQFKWYGVAIHHFGSWNKFVSACGLPPRKRTDRKKVKYSDEFLVKEFVATKKKLNHIPVMHEFQYSAVAQRRFGTWRKFIEFAENYKEGEKDG